MGLPFADAEVKNQTQRTLESCEENAVFALGTAPDAGFAQDIVPGGSGTVSGIVTANPSGNGLMLMLNEAADITYTGERCGPEVLDCPMNIKNGQDKVFLEDFDNIADTNELNTLGWTNTSVNGSGTQFEGFSPEGNTAMSVSASGSGEDDFEAWLVTPAINLDTNINEELYFDIEVGYDNGTGLAVLITDNYTGNPETTVWKALNVDIPVGPSDGFSGFLSSGPVSISCLEGDVHIAFRYRGSDSGLSTTYRIDNVSIVGNP